MKLFTTALLFFSISFGFTQDYLDHIAEETCECMGDVDDYKTYEEFSMNMGLCMFSEAEPYTKKLKKDFKIDLNDIEEYGTVLGEQLGLRLVTVCPKFLEAISKFDDEVLGELMDEDEADYDSPSTNSEEEESTGIVKSYEEEGFLSLKVEENDGSVTKVLWLGYVDSDFDLDNDLENLKGLEVSITYTEQELYDVKSKEYRYYKVLTSLKTKD
ncbi:MAG: hypothetical protein AB8B53_04265 [Flavobacteriales bacterium]